jgi:hypothetical protein
MVSIFKDMEYVSSIVISANLLLMGTSVYHGSNNKRRVLLKGLSHVKQQSEMQSILRWDVLYIET